MSPVLQMETYLPKIQEAFRRDGYPRFEVLLTQEIQLGPEFKVATGSSWVFSNKDKSEAVVLSPLFVSLMASEYDTFDVFAEKLERVLRVVAEAADLDLCERIGLRYVDLIRLDDGETWDDYLAPGLLGPPMDRLSPEKFLYRFEGRATTSAGELAIKLFQSDDGRFLPPDLSPQEIEYKVSVESGEVVTVLDTDHFSVGPRDFDPPSIIEQMWLLHDKIDMAFRSAVTEKALQKWGSGEPSD